MAGVARGSRRDTTQRIVRRCMLLSVRGRPGRARRREADNESIHRRARSRSRRSRGSVDAADRRAVWLRYGKACRAVDGVADLRSRSGRHALLAAHADHAGQRRSAAGGVGLSHAARNAGDAAAAGRRRASCGGGTWSWPRPRWIGLRLERDHAARRRRHDVHQPRRTAASSRSIRRPARRSGSFSCPSGNPVDARRRVLARRRADAAADRLRLERRQALFARRQDRQAQRRRSATSGSRRSRTRPRSCRACPAATV